MSRQVRCLLSGLILFLFSLSATAEPPTEWVWQNPLPQGNTLEAVWGRSATDVYAIGGQQTLMRWDGRDAAGRRQASGVYFASVRTEFGREVQKMTLFKWGGPSGSVHFT